MSNFTPQVKFETEFEDDKITMSLSRMRRVDMLRMMKVATEAGAEVTEDGTMTGTLDPEAMFELSADLLPKYVSNFAGLKTADGEAVDIETVVDQVYFIDLAGKIFEKVISISNMGKSDSKNSPAQPPMSGSEQVMSGGGVALE